MRGHANDKIMNNFVFQEVIITNVFIHVTLCRLQVKGVTWHLSNKVCWNSSSIASLKDLFTTHLEPYATEVILFSDKYVSELCIEHDEKQRFKEGFVAPACQLHH